MAKEYKKQLSVILNEIRPRLSTTHGLEFRNCFGAIAGYVNGKIFVSYGKFGLALKLHPKTLNELFQERGVKPLRYFKNGHIKKEYAVIPIHILKNKNKLRNLINKSIRFTLH